MIRGRLQPCGASRVLSINVMTMKLAEPSKDNPWQAAANLTMRESWRNEIERAITNQKRTELDKFLRRPWYKAEVRKRRQFREQVLARE